MRQFILPILLIAVISCEEKNVTIDPTFVRETTLTPVELQDLTIDSDLESWTTKMRIKTIQEVNALQIDSIVSETTDFYINQFYYSNGQKVKAIGFTKDKKDTVGFYYKSPGSEFNAIGETCPNNNTDLIDLGSLHTYRGLKFKGKHIGIATYLPCDKSTFEKGIYFKGQRIGIWKTLNLKTNIVTEKEYGHPELINELKQLTKN